MSSDSFIVSKYGLDGLRQHWIPGNRRRNLPPREKRQFATRVAALAWIAANPNAGAPRGLHCYRCWICGQWHLSRNGRHGDPSRRVR